MYTCDMPVLFVVLSAVEVSTIPLKYIFKFGLLDPLLTNAIWVHVFLATVLAVVNIEPVAWLSIYKVPFVFNFNAKAFAFPPEPCVCQRPTSFVEGHTIG